MTQRRLFAALFVLAGLGLTVTAQEKAADKDKGSDKADLKWKFEKDKTFFQKMTTETKQTMKVMNSDVTQTQKQTFYFSWTPEKQDGTSWVIKQKIEGVQMDVDIGGSKITYDSTKDQAANNPLSEFFKALVGSEFKITLDTKDMKVTKIEGRDEFLKKLGNANPQMQPLLNQILSEKALMEMADPTFAPIPNKEETKGQSWDRKSTLNMGPIGTYENEYKYTYEGKDDKDKKLDKIKVETKLTYKEPGDVAGGGGLPFRIKKADLASTKADGTILFNPEKGRIDKYNMNLDLKGKLNIEIGGQTTEVSLEQTQVTSVETSDTNPLTPQKPK